MILIHDFYYYCPIPYMPVPENANYKDMICSYGLDSAQCDNCPGARIFKEFDLKAWRESAKKLLNNQADYVIFNSEFTRDNFQKLFGMKDRKNVYISYPNFTSRI